MSRLKPWLIRTLQSQVAASWAWVETCVGWPNGIARFLESTRKTAKKLSRQNPRDISFISLANKWFFGQNMRTCKFSTSFSANHSVHRPAVPGNSYIHNLFICTKGRYVAKLEFPGNNRPSTGAYGNFLEQHVKSDWLTLHNNKWRSLNSDD